ncbi:MAG: hypothetical protein US55_C0022G0010 [Candidatus Levybacteria bacterium GW2011_GWC2_37_7]|nr:MAG: hypothetical protein US55_C0022G0010 [Candidatus Levybacteria bacterium GW2011_GWC2_37_7]
MSTEDLEKEINMLKARNKRVEKDKDWETSSTRRGLLVIFTYLAIGFYLNAIQIENPWLNAIVPSIGFLLSTLTLPYFKNLWIKFNQRKEKQV